MDHLSLVGIVPWEFVAQIANLLIQAALFKKFLFKPVQGIIAKRRGEVNAIYGEAEAARTAAEEEKAEYRAASDRYQGHRQHDPHRPRPA